MSATQSGSGAPAAKSRSTRSSATRTPGTRIVVGRATSAIRPRDAGLAHQPLDALAADPLAVVEDQLGVDPRRAVDAAALAVDLADPLGQPRVLERRAATAAAASRRESRSGRPRARGTSIAIECSAFSAAMNPNTAHRVPPSLAKKAAAFFRISRSSASDPVLAPQPAQLLALVAGQTRRLALVDLELARPVTQRLRRDTQLDARAAEPTGRSSATTAPPRDGTPSDTAGSSASTDILSDRPDGPAIRCPRNRGNSSDSSAVILASMRPMPLRLRLERCPERSTYAKPQAPDTFCWDGEGGNGVVTYVTGGDTLSGRMSGCCSEPWLKM